MHKYYPHPTFSPHDDCNVLTRWTSPQWILQSAKQWQRVSSDPLSLGGNTLQNPLMMVEWLLIGKVLGKYSYVYVVNIKLLNCSRGIISSLFSHLSHGLLVLDFYCTQQSQHVLGSLSHGMLHAVVMPQLLHPQLHPAQVRFNWETVSVLINSGWTATCREDTVPSECRGRGM